MARKVRVGKKEKQRQKRELLQSAKSSFLQSDWKKRSKVAREVKNGEDSEKRHGWACSNLKGGQIKHDFRSSGFQRSTGLLSYNIHGRAKECSTSVRPTPSFSTLET